MKERITTLALAAAALVLFYQFFFPKPMSDSRDTVLPLSTEVGSDGYQALWRWLQAERVPVAALRQPYTDLSAVTDSRPARGNLLITTLPHRLPARDRELGALEQWVDRGNTLLIMAALDDTPQWALGGGEGFLHGLGRMTRMRFDVHAPAGPSGGTGNQRRIKVGELLHALEPRQIVIQPVGSHALFEGVRSVFAASDFPASHWLATPMDASPVLALASRVADDKAGIDADPAIWLEPRGEGQILIFSVASPFTNRALAEKDNARLFSNIVAWSLSRGGAVIFDDAHQGAVAYYDAKAFFHDPRLHRTLLWILALWLLFVLGSLRLRPAEETWNPADVTAFIGVTGGFFAATLTRADTAQRLFHNFFDSVRRDAQLPQDGTPVWDRLAADARVDQSLLRRSMRLYEDAQSGKHVDLIQLHNTLSRLQGILE